MTTDLTHAQGFIDFVDASPSPYHACETAAALLRQAGFSSASEDGPLPGAGRHFLIRGGSLIAWVAPAEYTRGLPMRILGAHTDSPNLRIKPNPDGGRAGFRQLGVEVYGGVLLNSWLDRDLGLSGRVSVIGDDGPAMLLLHDERPLLRVPQLAIHLDRDIYDKGLLLNRQTHMAPFWALGGDADGDGPDDPAFANYLADALDIDAASIAAWDVMCHPIEPSRVIGLDKEFVSAPRIDNQLSCYAAITALTTTLDERGTDPDDHIAVVTLFDHEEIGSASDRGAAGAFLGSVLERVTAGLGADRTSHLESIANSICISSDCAHATNPNYADRHEPDHTIALNGGPVLKVNANLRYATDAESGAVFVDACDRAGVPHQRFVNRTDLACGSTIGPATAAQLGISTVDVGAPQLAMHSARELTGSSDPATLTAALTAFLQ